MKIEEVSPQDNGYYYYWGFDFDPFNDPLERGLKYHNNSVNHDEFFSKDLLMHELDDFIYPGTENFVEDVINNRALIDQLWTKHGNLNVEFLNILALDYNSFSNEHSMFMSGNPNFMRFYKLKLGYLLLSYLFHNKVEALNQMKEELKLSRNFLENSDSDMFKILSYIVFIDYFFLVNDILDNSDKDFNDIYSFILSIEPIQITERSYEKCVKLMFNEKIKNYRFENSPMFFRGSNNFLFRFILNFLKDKNELINRTYTHYQQIIDFAVMTGLELYEFEDDIYENFIDSEDKKDLKSLLYLHDIMSINVSLYQASMKHYYTVDSNINMLKLKAMIMKQDLTSEQIPAFLKAHKDSLNNPSTEEAIQWDAIESVLYFGGPYRNRDFMGEIKIELSNK